MTIKNKAEQIEEIKLIMSKNSEYMLQSHRNKLLGYWAGNIMYNDQSKILEYIEQLMLVDLEVKGDEDIIEKIYSDLNAFGYKISYEDIKKKIIEFDQISQIEIKKSK